MVPRHNLSLGKKGEEAALSLLKENGYKILARNYRTKTSEIDIVAKDKDTLCFIEVKARQSERQGLPLEAVSASKQKQISKAALSFLKQKNLMNNKTRFDVVSVIYRQDAPSCIDLIKNAFDLDNCFTI